MVYWRYTSTNKLCYSYEIRFCFSDLPYSDHQLEYFNRAPGDRGPIMDALIQRVKDEEDEENKKHN